VISLSADKLSSIEKDIVAEIRSLRALPTSGPLSALLESPARLPHHFILTCHGNVQLRLGTHAGELGIEVRTLERTFVSEYHKTMTQFQVEVRLGLAQHLLSIFPPTKISVIAGDPWLRTRTGLQSFL
jgi:AraC-like DNA-binding protein